MDRGGPGGQRSGLSRRRAATLLYLRFVLTLPISLLASPLPILLIQVINSFLHLLCFLSHSSSSSSSSSSARSVTFEDGADVFPDGDAAAAVELAESQLHVEQRDAPEHGHQQVGQQKGTWAGEGGGDPGVTNVRIDVE